MLMISDAELELAAFWGRYLIKVGRNKLGLDAAAVGVAHEFSCARHSFDKLVQFWPLSLSRNAPLSQREGPGAIVCACSR